MLPPPRPGRPSVDQAISDVVHASTSARTRESYSTSLTFWTRWCADQQPPVDPLAPTIADCGRYQTWWMDRSTSEHTVRTRRAPVVKLHGNMVRGGWLARNPWDDVRAPKAPTTSSTRSLPAANHARLLAHVAEHAPAHEVALIRLLAIEAFRRDGARLFRLDRFQATDDGWEYRYRVKGQRSVVAVIDDVTADAIQQAAAGRTTGFLFPSPVNQDQPLSESAVADIVSRWGKRSGIGHVAPHQLRKASITRVLEASGGDLNMARAHADHANVATTAMYYDGRTSAKTSAVAHVLNTTEGSDHA